MEISRVELLPAVMLTCLQTDKFKTGYMSLHLLSELKRETAPITALVPNVLSRGTKRYPDMEKLANVLSEMYGAQLSPHVRKLGEIQAVGFSGSFIEDRFVPEKDGLLTRFASLLGQLLLEPETRGGLLLPAYVESEKEKLLEQIRGRVNEKRSYSLLRLLELMCCYEDYATPALGLEEEAETIHYQKLTRRYKELLSQSPIELFYCGSEAPERIADVMSEVLLNLPRGEICDELGTDIRMNAVEAQPRVFTEEMDVTQGKLAVGFRLGDCMEDPDVPAIRVFNAVYGGCLSSKLFMNVREKLSLAYYASSGVDVHKGLLYVSSGIEFDKYEPALTEIMAQLDAVRRGEITDEELTSARKAVSTDLRTAADSQAELEHYWFSQNLSGDECAPEEMAALAELVTKDEIVDIARGVECDAVYFLRGEEADDETD